MHKLKWDKTKRIHYKKSIARLSKRRGLPVLIALIIFLSTLFSMMAPYLEVKAASIQSPTTDLSGSQTGGLVATPEVRAETYNLKGLMQACAAEEMRTHIYIPIDSHTYETSPSYGGKSGGADTGRALSEFEWFNNSNKTSLLQPGNQSVTCTEVATKFMSNLGYTSGKAFLQDMGYKLDEGKDRSDPRWVIEGGDTKQKRREGVQSIYYQAGVRRVGAATYGGASKYINSYAAFTGSDCKAEFIIPVKDATPARLAEIGQTEGIKSTIKMFALGDDGVSSVEYIVTYTSSSSSISMGATGSQYHVVDTTGTYGYFWQYTDKSLNSKKSCGELMTDIQTGLPDMIQWNKANPDSIEGVPGTTIGGDSDEEGDSSCVIGYVGWIICPVVNFMASIADKAYDLLAKNFLTVPASFFSDGGDTHKAWKQFQTIGNVILVILFLIIIFSQLTGFGITNYGIKKLLPKIIIVAILMNLSFIITVLLVDLSNIVGFSIKDLLSNVVAGSPPTGQDYYNFGSTGKGAGGWVVLAGLALAGGVAGVAASGGVTLLLVALVPVLLAALISILMIFFILIARQVLIVLLIVIAPVAIALVLLPNTSQWYKKWQKTFIALLLVFPIIGAVYGGSTLASKIMENSLSAQDDSAQLMEIIVAGIMVIPFLIVPSLLKRSLDSVGNIGAMAGNLTARASRGLDNKLQDSDMAKAKRQQHRDRTQSIRAGRYGGRNPFNKARSSINTKLNSGQGAYGQYRRRQVDKYDAAQAREAQEAIGGAGDYLSSFTYDNEHGGKSNLSRDQIFELAMDRDAKDSKGNVLISPTSTQRKAAMAKIAPMMTSKQTRELATSTSSMEDPSMRQAASQAVAQNGAKVPFAAGELAAMQAGTYKEEPAITDWATNRMTSESLAGMDVGAMQAVGKVAETNNEVKNALEKRAVGIQNNAELISKMTQPQLEFIEKYSSPKKLD